MVKRYEECSQLEFQETFATGEACMDHLRRMRWPDGFVCPCRGHGKAWYINTRKVMDCRNCRIMS
ncbi:MAG: transposase [Acidobacteriota bacterium]|jgi:hypothetical protein